MTVVLKIITHMQIHTYYMLLEFILNNNSLCILNFMSNFFHPQKKNVLIVAFLSHSLLF